MPKGKPLNVPKGTRFGKLVTQEEPRSLKLEKRTVRVVSCLCDCGNIKDRVLTHLTSGNTSTCGCAKKNSPARTHGMTGTKIHQVWKRIKQRCLNPKSQDYYRYGAVGIKICDEWCQFKTFYDWAITSGYEDGKKLSVDRIDPTKGYYPENLRWATQAEQTRNRRTNIREGSAETYSRFKGVNKSGLINKETWVASISHNGIKHHLGTFDNEINAARAYNAKAKELFKEFARLNDVSEDSDETAE